MEKKFQLLTYKKVCELLDLKSRQAIHYYIKNGRLDKVTDRCHACSQAVPKIVNNEKLQNLVAYKRSKK